MVVRSRALLVALVAAALPAALLIAVVIHFTVGVEIFLVVALVLFEWSDRRRRRGLRSAREVLADWLQRPAKTLTGSR